MTRTELARSCWLLPALVASALVYFPITANFFSLDDFLHMYAIADGRVWSFLVTPHQGHMLPVRNALFVLCWKLFGTDPRGYLWLSLLTHLVNVGLLFAVVRACTGSALLACFGATLWGLSPLNEGALGWYSVYGQVLLTTIVLWLLLRVARWGDAGGPSRGEAVTWYALLLAGTTLFGTGIGVALAAAVVVALLYPRARFTRRLFASLLLVVPALYALVHRLYAFATGAEYYATPQLSLLPQAVPNVTTLITNMLAFGAARPLAGYLDPSWPYPGWQLASLAAAYWFVVGAALVVARGHRRRVLLTCLALVAGAFGIIALGRGLTFTKGNFVRLMPDINDLAISTRYYYAPTALLVVLLCLALQQLGARLRLGGRIGAVLFAAWAAMTAAAYAQHPLVIDHFDGQREQVEALHVAIRRSVAATPPGETVYLKNRMLEPLVYLVRTWEFPGWAGLFVVFYRDNEVDGRPVRFILFNPEIVERLRRRAGTRSAGLVVTVEEFQALRRSAGAGGGAAPGGGPR